MSIVLPHFYQRIASALNASRAVNCLSATLLLLVILAAPVFAERAEQNDEPPAPQQLPRLDLGDAPEAQPLPNNTNEVNDPRFDMGVKAYRDGDYRQASKILEGLHRQAPENTKFTYYLAITEAQLGRFQQAKRLYAEIVTLDPNGETASLAKEGLKYLPPETGMDLPPRFNQGTAVQACMAVPQAATGSAISKNGQAAPANAVSSAPSVSPQDLMAWQMLMGQGNGNNMGGYNPMGGFMPWMMTGLPNGTAGSSNGSPSIDPSVMSTMLMNQMMQNMNLGGEAGENR